MFLDRSLGRIRGTYEEYPRQFWILVLAGFIDSLGGAILFPFLTLFITSKFPVGMTEVGVLFGLFFIGSILGSALGGALSDRLGRKSVLIFGLAASGVSNLAMGLVESFAGFFSIAVVVGLFSNFGGPAQRAMVTDLLPEEKRAQGFAILRTQHNLAVTVGPAIGGVLAARSYLPLFICDTVGSLITAVIMWMVIRETRPATGPEEPEQTMAQALAGYRDVLRDVTFSLFLGACALMMLVYMQMNVSLAVFLRDTHGVSDQGFGYVMTLNAAMVVLFQFYVTRWTSRYRPLRVMAAGTLLYAIGFGMYGFVSVYLLFLLAMAIITVGEMVVTPTSEALVAGFAPRDMRGRYMAAFGVSWAVPSTVGPFLAGLVLDNLDQRWLWYIAGLVGLLAAGAFSLLQRRVGERPGEIGSTAAPGDGDRQTFGR